MVDTASHPRCDMHRLAERVHELQRLANRVPELEAALRFYADAQTYKPHAVDRIADIDVDEGKRARKALGEWSRKR